MKALLPLALGVVGALIGCAIGVRSVRGPDDLGIGAGLSGLFGALIGGVVGVVSGTALLVVT